MQQESWLLPNISFSYRVSKDGKALLRDKPPEIGSEMFTDFSQTSATWEQFPNLSFFMHKIPKVYPFTA